MTMTTAIILVSSVDSVLEAELEAAGGEFSQLQGLPKALLPITGGKTVLDYWWGAIEKQRSINDVYLVTNAKQFKHFERWATARGIPVSHVINDGSTMRETSLGAARDLLLGLNRANWGASAEPPDVLVIAGDSLFHREFDLQTMMTESHVVTGSSLVVSYTLGEGEATENRGIIEVEAGTRLVSKFFEKPHRDATESRLACPLFYVLKPNIVSRLGDFVSAAAEALDMKPSLGRFMEWMINANAAEVYSMRMPGIFRLIGNAGLREYLDLVEHFERLDSPRWSGFSGLGKLRERAYARVGLFGNPSDGYNGKTISLTIANFWAEATVAPSERLCLRPHPLFDPSDFGSLADLGFISRREGYQGGMRLLQAACKRFHEHVMELGVALPKRNFTLSYDTNIPRQVGLAGSSAIVTAAIKALMRFYDLDETHIARPSLPSLVLTVEAELGINAGLQDRVVQAYEGLVYMDFDAAHFERAGHGLYEVLPRAALEQALPLLWLAYCGEPSDSGAIHSDVKQRHQAGDPEAVGAMRRIADVAERAKRALLCGDQQACRALMAENFALRRALFGDDALGAQNLRMIDIAAQYGGVAKFPGSGGAVVGTCDAAALPDLRAAYEKEHFVFVILIPHFGGGSE
ncbi:hypothetical protein M885DRAFT_458770 [Pelagophyceae sp. CCMP2097]|nr:hypothetical protein M885DRAFT_458770 [Pelagophyceae sp. CCMP2097]